MKLGNDQIRDSLCHVTRFSQEKFLGQPRIQGRVVEKPCQEIDNGLYKALNGQGGVPSGVQPRKSYIKDRFQPLKEY